MTNSGPPSTDTPAEELTAEDAQLYARIFQPKQRPKRTGWATPSPEQLAEYYRELELIAASGVDPSLGTFCA